ncbi:MAG TPA: DUF6298 domain-containing protein [Phnomibacter sp.]|nr:DUF6298 domain-containing protein [Phnomibacter sp.]
MAQKPVKPPPPLTGEKGKLIYTADEAGNRIPDFSYCGYKASEQAIPMVAVKVTVPAKAGDATARIQAAIDYVSSLPLDANGFRGAVLLLTGKHEVLGQLRIAASGVVLRGSGVNSTTLVGAGNTRYTLVTIAGKKTVHKESLGIKIADAYVPVNAMSFNVAESFNAKEHPATIIIRRPSTANWIKTLGTEHFGGGITALGWKPGEKDLFFDRTITKVEGNTVYIDAPITTALDTTYGGAYMYFYTNDERINNSGVENLQLVSTYDKANPKDEDHRWNGINLEYAEDCWVRQVSFQHFAGSAVSVLETSKRITVEDCISLNPVSEIGGQRRYTFLTTGQQTLFQRCYAENGYHDFSTGFCAAGPNAFVQCESILPYSFSGAIDSWASGILFDAVNVDGNALRFGNRWQDGNGAGWAAANSVFWNCTAARIDCYKPPTAQNWAFGSWSQFAGDGYWNESNNSISPRSLYYAQLNERLRKNTDAQAQIMPVPTEASSSPQVEVAMQLTKEASKPKLLLKEWIEQAGKRIAIPVAYNGVKSVDEIGVPKSTQPTWAAPLQIKNGWLVRGDTLLAGRRQGVQWWSGGLQPKDIREAKPHLTRFVPGRTGTGLTDDINEVVADMKASNDIAIEHHYALWYDRRRDDHERIRRMDGEVWPPFYELPFARSGKETAWDGLSKYDLTKYNPFYWSRLKQFADLADQNGLVLMYQNYFQHNIIEAGAHYADFPWRTANNINNTGFVEPVNYAGDKRIFYAEQFYDLSNPVRKELHRKYIRQCLANFKDNNGVIQFISEEFTGPTHFVKFWLDVIREWEKETGKHPLIALSVTKDVQDTILNTPAYASVVDIIDIRYWHYQADGTAYAPMGGQNLAPRQHARLLKPKKTSFEQVYRAVLEYRTKYPGKAVLYSGDSYPEFAMAAFMAGGSMPVLPAGFDASLLQLAVGMKPVKSANENEYILSNGKTSLVYNTQTRKLEKK